MHYDNIYEGIFVDRPNRFIANVILNGTEVVCHVKNTGRCRELLVPGVTVYLQKCDNPKRKTKYDLIGVVKGNQIINIDSQIPNAAVCEWIENGNLVKRLKLLKREVKYGDSRFDIYLEYLNRDNQITKAFVEVKGVTLENDGIARFPDAPTIRGLKHVNELVKAHNEGYETYVVFVIQMKNIKYMEPNYEQHREFGEALINAERDGVNIIAVDCYVTRDSIKLRKQVEVRL